MNHLRNLFNDIKRKGFFHLIVSNLTLSLLGFSSQILVAKFLNPLELGQIKTMQSFIAVSTIFSGFGFNIAVLKLCSEKRSLEEKAFIFKKNLYYTITPLLFVLITLILCARLNLLSPDEAVNRWIPLFGLMIPGWTYTYLAMSFLQALKEIKAMAMVQTTIRIFGLICLILLTYLYGFFGYIISAVLVSYCILIPLFYQVKSKLGTVTAINSPLKRSMYYAKWGTAANGLETLGQWIDILILNYFISDRIGFGYYSLSTIFLMGLNQLSLSVQTISTPFFSEKSSNKEEFLRVFKKYGKLMFLFAFAITFLSIIIIPLFIQLFFGKQYAAAGPYFRVLAIKYFFWTACLLPGAAIFGLGKVRYNFIVSLLAAIISSVIIYISVSSYGIMGAAIGQAIGSCINFILILFTLRYVVKKHFAC